MNRKFVAKEVKRGNLYDGILLDPPSYGRGSKNEIWKIEDHLQELLDQLYKLKSSSFLFIHMSSHSPHITPKVIEQLLDRSFGKKGFLVKKGELIVDQWEKNQTLPCGSYCAFHKELGGVHG